MALGLFDVVGPVMHGPSSNHTGGANRIGYCIRQLIGAEPEDITLLFHPAYMVSYRGQASHTALIAGCLGYREYDPESVRSLNLAAERKILWRAAPYEPAKSRNLMGVRALVKGETYEIIGDSTGGGSILLTSINDVPVSLDGNSYVMVVYASDRELLEDAAALVVSEDAGAEITRQQGRGSDGRYLCCISCPEPLLAKGLDEMEKTAAARSQKLVCTSMNPLEVFRDKKKTPLCRSFEAAVSCLLPGEDLSELAIRYEMERSEVSREEILSHGAFILSVIRDALMQGEKERPQLLAGLADPGDGKRMLDYAASGHTLLDPAFSLTMARAMILGERNAGSCRIVASPTGGAAGTLPALILTMGQEKNYPDETMVRAFLVAALVGVIIGNKASFSGTVGGCQAEVGIGAAMGASAVTWMAGGNTDQVIQAAALTIKNLLGLSCDPPAPCTEVPCIKRNAMGAAAAYFGSELALAGIRSSISPDDVVTALADTQKLLPTDIKFGGTRGLAGTPSGQVLRRQWERNQK